MNQTLRMFAVIVVPLAVILGGTFYLYVDFNQDAQESRALVFQTHDVIDTAKSLVSAVQDAETGQRGYLITAEERYLDPYKSGVDATLKLLDNLAAAVSDTAEQANRVSALRSAVSTKLDELAKTIAIRRSQGFEPARALVLTDVGQASMDRIRQILSEIVAAETGARNAQLDATAVNDRRALTAAALCAFIAAGIIVVGAFVLAHGATRLRFAQQEVMEEAGLLKAVLDNTREGVLAFDGGSRLAAWNDGGYRLLGLPNLLAKRGTALSEFIDASRKNSAASIFEMPDSAEREGIVNSLSMSGRDLECFRRRMPNGGFLVTCTDVTQRSRTEAIIRQAQKMEAIGHLTGGLAHDFNNVLQVILANLDLVRGELAGHPDAERRVADARGSAERGAQLTRQLLAFARRQPLEPIAVNLGRFIGDVAHLLRRTLGETIEVETVIAGGLWNALVDPTQVENVLLNLALNARDAMPEGGKLTIELGNAALDDVYAAANTEVTPGQYVMMAVTDTGSGMAPDVIARAFEPFFTTKPEGKGTGLGLSMVYGFVKQSGGHVKIYSEPGQGTTVRIYLPRSRRPEDLGAEGLVPSAIGGTETVLVVEDDGAVRKAAVELLGDLGYQVLEAADGESALSIVSAGKPIDLLFTDVVMSGSIQSRELARRAQALQPGLAVLFTSGYTENAVIHHGRLDEGVNLLSKPYGKDELARKIRSVLDHRSRRNGAPSAPGVASRKLRLLVVEDEPLVRMACVEMLAELGHVTEEAGDAAAALAAVDRLPDLDAALVDLGLPGMRGEDLVAEMRRRRPNLGLIVVTGYTAALLRGDLKASRDLIFVGKPYDAATLERAIERLARRRGEA